VAGACDCDFDSPDRESPAPETVYETWSQAVVPAEFIPKVRPLGQVGADVSFCKAEYAPEEFTCEVVQLASGGVRQSDYPASVVRRDQQ
jgi:hypothetical protein